MNILSVCLHSVGSHPLEAFNSICPRHGGTLCPACHIFVYLLEHITIILAVERLRLMRFNNRLIIDYFKQWIYSNGNFPQMIDPEIRNMNPLLGEPISAGPRNQMGCRNKR